MSDARSITLALGGRWGRGYGLAFCPAHDNRQTPALSLRDGAGGRLLAYCFAGCSFSDVMAALNSRGLAGKRTETSPRVIQGQDEKRLNKRRTAIARAEHVWSQTRRIAGSPAETYLRGRAIACPLPDSIRYVPECWHPSAQRLPAMVAKVEHHGELVGVHRTYLSSDGTKADIEPSKAMLGACSGGHVRLSDGSGPLVVCEGIETGLSLVDALADLSPTVCAALSTSGIRGLDLDGFERRELVVAPDGDAPGRVAADTLAGRAAGSGWSVRVMHPPVGSDWNDVDCGATT